MDWSFCFIGSLQFIHGVVLLKKSLEPKENAIARVVFQKPREESLCDCVTFIYILIFSFVFIISIFDRI